MSKITNENKKLIQEKLDYIGLDLNKIPRFLKQFEALDFRPVKSYDDQLYKVYKFINVQDVQILVTPTDRLTDLKEKYKLASPLFTYLEEKDEESIEKFATFLKMLTDVKIDKIEELEEEQKQIKQSIPTEVKYKNNFVWQIYYSDYAQKYFMLVPTKEQDCSAMFYLLKKQIETRKSKKKEIIYVPISHKEYSGAFLTKSEIADIENYLWYFTKEWPSVYEVFDEKGNMNIKVVGITPVYEKLKSSYVVELNSKEEALEFYKLLKAMFILATGAPDEYKFACRISLNGSLQFIYKDEAMLYKNLPEFIKNEYLEKIENIKNEIQEKEKLEKRLKKFNNLVEELTQEYLARQRQIATFLECKKTFFGKVKYFFKKKKTDPVIKRHEKIERENTEKQELEMQDISEEKEQYTIEDLINVCSILDEKIRENKNINLDINAIESKKDMLTRKIDNADLYISEIDKHKKSIFEFWKFTSKDETQTLNEGEEQEKQEKEKIEKYFNYETDLEDLGKIVDELQRRKLSKNETDAIFAIREAEESFKEIIKNKDVELNSKIVEELNKLKEEYKDNLEYISVKDFDIFGGMSDDKTKVKTINNEKHRENKKDKYKVLNVNLETEPETYADNILNYYKLIQEAFCKIQAPYNMSIYKLNSKKGIEGINVFDINPESALSQVMQSKKENIILTRINVKEGMPILYYSNIMFYDNFNKTLPMGMNLSSEVLADIDKLNLKFVKEEQFNINSQISEFKVITKKVKLYEYDANFEEQL